MSEPSLDVTWPAADSADAWQTAFWQRLSFMLFAQDTVFETWQTYIEASGSADQKWFADRYSGYVLGLQYQNTDAIIVSGVPTYWDKTKDKNGFCIRDVRTGQNFGGFCLFPVPSTADGSAAVTFKMTNADFVALEGLWTSTG